MQFARRVVNIATMRIMSYGEREAFRGGVREAFDYVNRLRPGRLAPRCFACGGADVRLLVDRDRQDNGARWEHCRVCEQFVRHGAF